MLVIYLGSLTSLAILFQLLLFLSVPIYQPTRKLERVWFVLSLFNFNNSTAIIPAGWQFHAQIFSPPWLTSLIIDKLKIIALSYSLNCSRIHSKVNHSKKIDFKFWLFLKNPVAHCWSEPTHFKRKFCNACRKRLEDNLSVRCESNGETNGGE